MRSRLGDVSNCLESEAERRQFQMKKHPWLQRLDEMVHSEPGLQIREVDLSLVETNSAGLPPNTRLCLS